MRTYISIIVLCLAICSGRAQSISDGIPSTVDPEGKYIFYLHGGIVGVQGVNAVSPYYGAYKYLPILDSLANRGFHVISEVRPADTREEAYAAKMSRQIDILTSQRVPLKNIFIVGASLGAYIAIELAYIQKEGNLNYALLGLCSDYAVGYYQKYNDQLKGNFLSIFESKDEKHSCAGIFNNQKQVTSYQEIELKMGNGHAFLYQPYPEWIDPLMDWIRR